MALRGRLLTTSVTRRRHTPLDASTSLHLPHSLDRTIPCTNTLRFVAVLGNAFRMKEWDGDDHEFSRTAGRSVGCGV